jgi:uncharacterized damage-inducible protein DinB
MATMIESLKADMEREAATTRRCLERVPDGQEDWKPHEKSMPLGYMASLLAVMPSWLVSIITQDELDIAKPREFEHRELHTREDRLKTFDKAVAAAREAFDGTTEEQLLSTSWKLLVQGKVVAEQTRCMAILENSNHVSHHRGQLTVYLRLLGIPIPSIFGPSADEKVF